MLKWWYVCSRQLRLYINLLESARNYFIFGADVPDVYATRWALLVSLNICLPKTTVLCQESQAICENQLSSSHRLTEHFQTMLCTEHRKTVTDTS